MEVLFSSRLRLCLLLSCLSLGALASICRADQVNRNLNTASPARTDVEILESARAANDDVYSSLQSFVCNEEINRFRSAMNGLASRPLDIITARLSFEGGVEQYTNVHQNNLERPGISSLTGAWSEGEYGTLLLQTQKLLETQRVKFEDFDDVKGEQAAIYRFDVSSDDSPWELVVAGRHDRLPFRTNVWISIKSGEILKIDRASLAVASETRISEIRWGITLGRVDLNGKSWLLPSTGSYAILYNDTHRREWNEISFTGYQRYGSQTALKFH